MRTSYWEVIAVAGLAAALGGKAWACPANSLGSKYAAGALQTAVRAMAPGLPAAVVSHDSDGGRGDIVGLWDTKFFDNTGALIDEGYETFTSDGQELLVDTSPPAIDNVCNGLWIQTGTIFKLKHVAWDFDNSGNLVGRYVFHITITLDPKGNSFSGTAILFQYDLSGNLVFHASGTVKGTRITVDF